MREKSTLMTAKLKTKSDADKERIQMEINDIDHEIKETI